jgi:hypothetical protein
MIESGDATLSVHDRMRAGVDKLLEHITETHVVPTNSPLWYVYAGHNLMITCETREAAEKYMQTGGTRYVATTLCQHEMGPASATQSA